MDVADIDIDKELGNMVYKFFHEKTRSGMIATREARVGVNE